MGLHPPCSPQGGLHPPVVPFFPPQKFSDFEIFFLKHAHMEFITRLGHFFFRDFFGNFFFRGTTPPCRAIFFLNFFSQKYFFLRHMGDFFGRLLQGVIGPPSKKHDPGKIPGTRTMCSPNFGKKCGSPHWRMVQRGEIPHFFSFFENRR